MPRIYVVSPINPLWGELRYFGSNHDVKAGREEKVKTDKRDAENIARCLAYHTYSPVHIPSEQDEQVKEYIRMRDDHKLALKKVKQQILAFCLRHGYVYTATKNH